MRHPPLRPLLTLLVLFALAGADLTLARTTHRRPRRPRRPPRPVVSEQAPPEPARMPPVVPRVDVPIVFVSRGPVPGDPTAVPGLGPHRRATVTGGRLMVREPDARVRELLPAGTMWDVAHPAVAMDGARLAFAGVRRQGDRWRLWLVNADGSGLRALGEPPGSNADDLHPCWIADHWLAFASTAGAMASEYGNVPATNIWIVRDDGQGRRRVTAERNGAETPSLDPTTGRLLYARWWTNRHRPSDVAPGGLTLNAAEALGDSINLWQVVSVTPDSSDVRLELGDPRTPRGEAAYAPAVLASGAIAAVTGVHLALSPRPGGLELVVFGLGPEAKRGGLPRGIGPSVRVAGAVAGDRPGDPYHDARGLAAPAACAPAALPAAGMVYAYDPGARGDFGLWLASDDGEATAPLLDLPGTLELDPAPLAARRAHLVVTDSMLDAAIGRVTPPSPVDADGLARASQPGFTFHCLNLFGNAERDTPLPPAPPPRRGLRMRFFAALPRPGTVSGDTAVLLREQLVGPRGEILAEHLPTGVPLFEQVVDSLGHVLMSAHGPAHVPGFNPSGAGTRRCIGCHTGHSAIPVPADTSEAAWFDAGPAAMASAHGGGEPAVLVDRATHGGAWLADGPEGGVVLRWATPLVVREVALYGLADAAAARGELVLRRAGVELQRLPIPDIVIAGTHVAAGDREVDEIEVDVQAMQRRDTRPVGLSELEVIARLP